jgi:gas vesicle protein
MSQRDGFTSGFLAGAFVGGVFGGIIGSLIASRRDPELTQEEETELINSSAGTKKASAKRRQIIASDNEGMEIESTRRSLEDKIAQLNATIDEVRKHLGNVNGSSPQSINDRSLTKES